MCEIDAIENTTEKVDFKFVYSLEYGNQPDLIAQILTGSLDLRFTLMESRRILQQEVHMKGLCQSSAMIEDEGFFNLTNVSVSESVRVAGLCIR
jgi:hypothetical protein